MTDRWGNIGPLPSLAGDPSRLLIIDDPPHDEPHCSHGGWPGHRSLHQQPNVGRALARVGRRRRYVASSGVTLSVESIGERIRLLEGDVVFPAEPALTRAKSARLARHMRRLLRG